MSKTSKKTVAQETHQAVEQVVQVETVAPVAPVAPAAPVVPIAQPEVQVETEVQDEKAVARQTQYEELLAKLEQAQDELGMLKTSLKKFYKLVEKDITKASKGRRRVNRERSPTGFGKAGVIPEGLRTLLKIGETVELTRPQVTKMLYKYLDDNNLRDPQDKRIIRTNTALATALGLSAEQMKSINETNDIKGNKGLNFYNIQKYVATLYKDSVGADDDVEETEVETDVEQVVQVKGRGKAKKQ